ncbi:MAG: RNA-binding S4 domain-containing protein [Acholeplasmataceae bacterium]|jgi:ribosome-associated protein|nr:RNA-binding S4 domain-containing protein [Acholeplasmataceae bacterium]
MQKFKIKGEFITLGQFVKANNLVSSGGMVKPFLAEIKIVLNGVEENRRGKKIFPGDQLEILGKKIVFTND